MEIETKEPRRGTRRIKIALGLGLTVALAAGLATYTRANGSGGKSGAGAKKNGDKKEKESPTVAVQKAETGAISAYITATANLVAEDEVKIVAEAEGKVVQLLTEEGDFVRKGQKVVQIDKGDALIAAQKAELGLRNAQINLDRSENMAAEKLISAQDLDKARFERDQAAHNLADARYRLEKTAVVAPFDGKVTIRKVNLGQTVKLSEELFTLADFDPLVARIFLPEREVLDLEIGQGVQIVLKAKEEVRFRGRIRQISPVVDPSSGTVKVTVEAVAPPANVRPGAFVSVNVVRETHASALLVPRQAVIRELAETYVYVAEGTKAVKRPVQVGLEEGEQLEIVGGLKAGEKVITSGQGGLKDQAAIKIATPATPKPTPTGAAKAS